MTEWIGPPVECNRCGRRELVPIPLSRKGVPYWGVPAHRYPNDDICPNGLAPLAGQYIPA